MLGKRAVGERSVPGTSKTKPRLVTVERSDSLKLPLLSGEAS